MKTSIFVNLGTKDLEKSKEFFKGLGFSINPQFTDENAACVVISENIFAMILTEEFFKKFTNKEIIDAHKCTEIATCLSLESKAKVDEFANKAVKMGATENIVPEMQQGDYMYGRSINDLDGHIWEVMWMDPTTIK